MAICCETFILKKEIAKMMLETVKKIIGEHFFSSCDLLKFAWCSNYQLDSRIVRYPIELGLGLGSIKNWFNHSPVRYDRKNLWIK